LKVSVQLLDITDGTDAGNRVGVKERSDEEYCRNGQQT
jgi:hypothetical protein